MADDKDIMCYGAYKNHIAIGLGYNLEGWPGGTLISYGGLFEKAVLAVPVYKSDNSIFA